MASYIADPGVSEWSEFHRHFPDCPECSEVVAEWTALEASLRAGGSPGRHPDPEQLVALSRSDAAVPAEVREHLEGCRTCSDELAALRAFPFEKLERSAAPTPARAFREALESLRSLGSALLGRATGPEARKWLGEGIFTAPEPALVFQSSDAERAQQTASPDAPPLVAVLAAGEGALAGEVFPILAGETRLGRGPDCEIPLRGAEFSRLDAVIRARPDHIAVVSHNRRRPVLVNGTPTREGELVDGDDLQVGAQRFQLRVISPSR